MSIVHEGFEPEEGAPVLVARPIFEEMLAALAERDGEGLEVQYGATTRGTTTFCEATIYTTEPQPDPLTVGQD